MDAGTWSWILPVAKDAYENREEILNNWDKFRKFFENKETTIAVTGLPGAGKSVLCDYLTGKAYSVFDIHLGQNRNGK